MGERRDGGGKGNVASHPDLEGSVKLYIYITKIMYSKSAR